MVAAAGDGDDKLANEANGSKRSRAAAGAAEGVCAGDGARALLDGVDKNAANGSRSAAAAREAAGAGVVATGAEKVAKGSLLWALLRTGEPSGMEFCDEPTHTPQEEREK